MNSQAYNRIFLKGFIVFIVFIFLCFNSLYSNSKLSHWVCGMGHKHFGDESATIQNFYGDAPYLPKTGVNKALVVFVRFSDDNYDNDATTNPQLEWPASLTGLPAWAMSVINNSELGTHTEGSITDYFCKMSRDTNDGDHGKFHLIGQVYPQLVIPPHPRSWYPSGNSALKLVNEDVIKYLSANPMGIDFDSYDLYDNGTTNRTPDGDFDMLIVIYRFFTGLTFQGISQLSWDEEGYYSTKLGTKKVHYGFQQGSGIFNSQCVTLKCTVELCAHEYAHRLFGYGHLDYVGRFGLMDGENGSGPMCAYEREILNWITPRIINIDKMNVKLADAVTTSQTCKIPISSNEYFLFENRQRVFYFDAFKGDGSGLPNDTNSVDRILPGTGLMIAHINKTVNPDILFERADGSSPASDDMGKSTDPFKPGNKIQFTPWTKPNSDKRDGTSSGIAITNIRFYNSDTTTLLVDVVQNFSSGKITENSWWKNPVNLGGSVSVENGATLRIAPGTTVKLKNNTSITVESGSKMIAKGESSNQILFTTYSGTLSDKYNYIQSKGGNDSLKYCIFEYGLYPLYLYNAASGNPTVIENCTFRNNSHYGIRIYKSKANVKNCEMTNNGFYGVHCQYNPEVKFTGNRIHHNSQIGVYTLSSNLLKFYGNVIEYNGVGNSSYHGIQTSNADVIKLGLPYTWSGKKHHSV